MHVVQVILRNGNIEEINCETNEAAQKCFNDIIKAIKNNSLYMSSSNEDGWCLRGDDVSWVRFTKISK